MIPWSSEGAGTRRPGTASRRLGHPLPDVRRLMSHMTARHQRRIARCPLGCGPGAAAVAPLPGAQGLDRDAGALRNCRWRAWLSGCHVETLAIRARHRTCVLTAHVRTPRRPLRRPAASPSCAPGPPAAPLAPPPRPPRAARSARGGLTVEPEVDRRRPRGRRRSRRQGGTRGLRAVGGRARHVDGDGRVRLGGEVNELVPTDATVRQRRARRPRAAGAPLAPCPRAARGQPDQHGGGLDGRAEVDRRRHVGADGHVAGRHPRTSRGRWSSSTRRR